MITKDTYDRILPRYAQFDNAVTTFKALLNDNGLKLSIDYATLIFQVKVQQFTKLVAVDKGLKLRFDMAKTEKSKRELIEANSNLDGYDIVDQLRDVIDQLHSTLSTAYRSNDGFDKPTVNDLMEYDLNMSEYILSNVVSWTNKDYVAVFDKIKNYAKMLTDMVKMFDRQGIKIHSLTDVHRELDRLTVMDNGEATANELAVHQMMDKATWEANERKRIAAKQAAYNASELGQAEAARQRFNMEAARQRELEREAFARLHGHIN